MNLVDILVRDHDCLWISRPVYRKRGEGNLSTMFDIQKTCPAFGIPDLCEKGGRVQLNNHWVDAVIWEYKCISIHEKMPSIDAISFDFSGCVMAVFCLRGTWYSAHIQMGEYDRALDWIDFIWRERSNLTALGMFRPDMELVDSIPANFWDSNPVSIIDPAHQYASQAHLWGIITADGRFVSLCVYPLNDSFQQFRVLSIKEHYLSMDPQYYDSLFGPFQTLEAAKQRWNNFWETRPERLLFDCFRQTGSCLLI